MVQGATAARDKELTQLAQHGMQEISRHIDRIQTEAKDSAPQVLAVGSLRPSCFVYGPASVVATVFAEPFVSPCRRWEAQPGHSRQR